MIVTKVGAVRGEDASWIPALTPADFTHAVHDNLRYLGVDALDVVNLRVGGFTGRTRARSRNSLRRWPNSNGKV